MNKLLGQGGYGCVYWPQINCDGTVGSLQFVSKIQKKGRASENELNIGKKITTIKDFNKHFKVVFSSCNISIKTVKDSIINECDILNKNKDDYLVMKIPYVKFYNFNDFFDNTNKKLLHIYRTYKYLVKSLELLDKLNITHLDIKRENIIIDYDYTPIILDFGISINWDEIQLEDYPQIFYIYAPDYYPWCFEIQLINYIISNCIII